jgi:acyl-CoA synthetase (AMP-forming)/AMP-acid ligase II
MWLTAETDTSGTTGFPKPILWTHDWASSHAQEVAFNAPPDFELAGIQQMPSGSKALFFFPAFHASGVIGMVLLPILRGVVPVYPATWTTWGEAIEGALAAIDVLAKEESEAEGEKKWVVDNVSLPPPCIDYLATHNSLLEQLSQGARTVVWSGGSVSRSAGDALAVKMNVVNALASTEMGVWPFIRRSGTQSIDGLWEYFTPHPALTMRFDSVSETPGGMACEAVMVRNDGLEWDGYVQPLFKVYTDVQEKRLGDLFIQHPEDETLWKHVGRADDLLVFLTSEKFHPAAAERRLASHPAIAEVMMVGTRRPRASLIVRLQGGGREVPEDVWTLIEEVNRDSRVCARVQRNMVLVVDKPFMKTGKGSVQKSAMLDLYGQELDSLYG